MGLSVLLTRPQADAKENAAELKAARHTTILAPTLDIHVVPSVRIPDDASALVFTSKNAVHAAAHLAAGFSGPVFAVGEKTAAAAKDAGFGDVLAGNGNAADLVPIIMAAVDENAGPVVHLSGVHVRTDIVSLLRVQSRRATRAICYNARPATAWPDEVLAALGAGEVDVALYFSERTAEIAMDLAEKGGVKDALLATPAIALSQEIGLTLQKLGVGHVDVAPTPTFDAMMTSLNDRAHKEPS